MEKAEKSNTSDFICITPPNRLFPSLNGELRKRVVSLEKARKEEIVAKVDARAEFEKLFSGDDSETGFALKKNKKTIGFLILSMRTRAPTLISNIKRNFPMRPMKQVL